MTTMRVLRRGDSDGVKSVSFCPNTIKSAAGSHIQSLQIVASAKAAIRWQRRCFDSSQFCAIRAVDVDSESISGTHGCLDSTLLIDRHTVRAQLVAEVDNHLFLANHTVVENRKRI